MIGLIGHKDMTLTTVVTPYHRMRVRLSENTFTFFEISSLSKTALNPSFLPLHRTMPAGWALRYQDLIRSRS